MEDNEQPERPIKITRAEPIPYRLGRPYSFDPIPESEKAVAMDQKDIQQEKIIQQQIQRLRKMEVNWKKTLTVVLSAIAMVLANFGIEIPSWLVGTIDTISTLLIGLAINLKWFDK